MAVESNHEFWCGDDVTMTRTMDPVEDITGWEITLNMAASVGGTIVVTATASIVSALGGVFRFTIPSASTLTLAPRTYVWDARRTDSGSRDTLAYGVITLRAKV